MWSCLQVLVSPSIRRYLSHSPSVRLPVKVFDRELASSEGVNLDQSAEINLRGYPQSMKFMPSVYAVATGFEKPKGVLYDCLQNKCELLIWLKQLQEQSPSYRRPQLHTSQTFSNIVWDGARPAATWGGLKCVSAERNAGFFCRAAKADPYRVCTPKKRRLYSCSTGGVLFAIEEHGATREVGPLTSSASSSTSDCLSGRVS